nr:tyrosine-protein kinase, non-receptor Jak2 [Tanacetum cinerariifolium]
MSQQNTHPIGGDNAEYKSIEWGIAMVVVVICLEVRVIFHSFARYIQVLFPLNYLLVTTTMLGGAAGVGAYEIGMIVDAASSLAFKRHNVKVFHKDASAVNSGSGASTSRESYWAEKYDTYVKHVVVASMALKGLGGILFVIGSMIGDVHFDIHNEIKTEALETYAKITCRSVIKNPEERLTMTRVVIELEKALRLHGGEVSSIHILDGHIGNGLTKEIVIEVDQPEDDKPEEESKVVEETIVDDKPEEESKVFDETIGTDEIEESKVIEQIAEDIEDAKKENGKSAEENTVDTKPKEEPTRYTPITIKTAKAKGKDLEDGKSNKIEVKEIITYLFDFMP